MYTYINESLYPNQPELAKSYALRLLIHYVGDMAQPFHCESRFDSKYPDGDKGANAFPLPSHYSVTELHALIDKVLYVERNNIPRVSQICLRHEFLADVRGQLGHTQHVNRLLSKHLRGQVLLGLQGLEQPRLQDLAD